MKPNPDAYALVDLIDAFGLGLALGALLGGILLALVYQRAQTAERRSRDRRLLRKHLNTLESQYERAARSYGGKPVSASAIRALDAVLARMARDPSHNPRIIYSSANPDGPGRDYHDIDGLSDECAAALDRFYISDRDCERMSTEIESEAFRLEAHDVRIGAVRNLFRDFIVLFEAMEEAIRLLRRDLLRRDQPHGWMREAQASEPRQPT